MLESLGWLASTQTAGSRLRVSDFFRAIIDIQNFYF